MYWKYLRNTKKYIEFGSIKNKTSGLASGFFFKYTEKLIYFQGYHFINQGSPQGNSEGF